MLGQRIDIIDYAKKYPILSLNIVDAQAQVHIQRPMVERVFEGELHIETREGHDARVVHRIASKKQDQGRRLDQDPTLGGPPISATNDGGPRFGGAVGQVWLILGVPRLHERDGYQAPKDRSRFGGYLQSDCPARSTR